MDSSWARIAAVNGAVAVMMGAFGAHALKQRVDVEMLARWGTGSSYHLLHAAALCIAVTNGRFTSAGLFLAGTALFSGSLYAMVLTGNKKLGAITPLGGILLVGGWLALASWSGKGKAE